jgi:hypothetical protein
MKDDPEAKAHRIDSRMIGIRMILFGEGGATEVTERTK